MAAVKFQKPALFRKDMDAVLQTMVDEKIGPGEKKKLFVKSYATYCKKKDGVALRSFIDAVTISLKVLGLQEGDCCAISVLSPEVYSEAFRRSGIKPYLLDVDSEMMPDLASLKDNLDKGIKALLLFEPMGLLPSSITPYKDLGLPIIEDVTQSVGSKFGDVYPGAIGDIVISSTEEDSIVSTAGGAVLLSDNEEYMALMKKETSDYSPFIEMADMNAALGIVQLEKLPSVVSRRSTIWRIYQDEVLKRNRVKVFGNGSVDFEINGYGFSCIVNERPDETIALALKYQVTARKTFSKAIGSKYQDRFDKYPKAVPALSRAVSFPLYPFLSQSEISTVQKVVGILR